MSKNVHGARLLSHSHTQPSTIMKAATINSASTTRISLKLVLSAVSILVAMHSSILQQHWIVQPHIKLVKYFKLRCDSR